MTAASIHDVFSRRPRRTSEASDAVSANTQVKMESDTTLLRLSEYESAVIGTRLLRCSQCPKLWTDTPAARLVWNEEVTLKERWEKVPGWRWLYLNRVKSLFFSARKQCQNGMKQNTKPTCKTKKNWDAHSGNWKTSPELWETNNTYLKHLPRQASIRRLVATKFLARIWRCNNLDSCSSMSMSQIMVQHTDPVVSLERNVYGLLLDHCENETSKKCC